MQKFFKRFGGTIQYYTILVQRHPIKTAKHQNKKKRKREENEKIKNKIKDNNNIDGSIIK